MVLRQAAALVAGGVAIGLVTRGRARIRARRIAARHVLRRELVAAGAARAWSASSCAARRAARDLDPGAARDARRADRRAEERVMASEPWTSRAPRAPRTTCASRASIASAAVAARVRWSRSAYRRWLGTSRAGGRAQRAVDRHGRARPARARGPAAGHAGADRVPLGVGADRGARRPACSSLPGAKVDADTLLVELSNPDAELAALEADREVAAAEGRARRPRGAARRHAARAGVGGRRARRRRRDGDSAGRRSTATWPTRA